MLMWCASVVFLACSALKVAPLLICSLLIYVKTIRKMSPHWSLLPMKNEYEWMCLVMMRNHHYPKKEDRPFNNNYDDNKSKKPLVVLISDPVESQSLVNRFSWWSRCYFCDSLVFELCRLSSRTRFYFLWKQNKSHWSCGDGDGDGDVSTGRQTGSNQHASLFIPDSTVRHSKLLSVWSATSSPFSIFSYDGGTMTQLADCRLSGLCHKNLLFSFKICQHWSSVSSHGLFNVFSVSFSLCLSPFANNKHGNHVFGACDSALNCLFAHFK